MTKQTRERLEERRRTLAALASIEKKLYSTSKREEFDRPERESELIAEALRIRIRNYQAKNLRKLRKNFEDAGIVSRPIGFSPEMVNDAKKL